MKKYLKLVIALVIVLAIASPWAYFLKMKADAKVDESRNNALIRFQQSHGTAKMTQFLNPKELYFATWETDRVIGMSMYVDGVWVVIGTQEKPKVAPSTETPKP